MLGAHYRQPLDWSDETVEDARSKLDRLYGAVRGIDVPDSERRQAAPLDGVVEALENDLNTPDAMAAFFGLAKQLNKIKEDDADQSQGTGGADVCHRRSAGICCNPIPRNGLRDMWTVTSPSDQIEGADRRT